MTSEKDCGDWETKSEHEVNEHFRKNIGRCHICRDDFIENSFVNWHPKECTACHKECRDRLAKPDEPEGRKHGDENFEESREARKSYFDLHPELKEKFDQEHIKSLRRWEREWEALVANDYPEEREFTEYGKPMWNRSDNLLLEGMYRAGKTKKEMADALTRELPYGYYRSEDAVRSQIHKLKLETKIGRYLHSSWQHGRPLPPTEKGLRWLKKLGYDGPKPTTWSKAWELTEVWFNKPTSPQLESELRATGYDGPIPESNKETYSKINEKLWKNTPITEPQTIKIKQICALIGKPTGKLPTNKREASLLIDRLKAEAKKRGIDVPKSSKFKSTMM
jgi:hypothetical protein